MHKKNYVNDVTTLNPVKVKGILYPQTTAEIKEIVKNYNQISIGGGHYSMGGQTAVENSIHIDMREYNKVLSLNIEKKEITVNAGITWKEIQKVIDTHDLSISIMQTYSNFTVGGSVSVNVHGRYIGAGPLALSIKEFKFIDANAQEQTANKEKGKEYFEMLVGGYGGIGIITDVTLKLEENTNVKQHHRKMSVREYLSDLESITEDVRSIFHNADIYPPHYNRVNSVTWMATEEDITEKKRIQKVKKFYPLEMYALWAVSSTPFGPLRREHLYDTLIFAKKRIFKRNYEASYDVAELEPLTRKNSTYVLQEYFIPKENAEKFIEKLAKVFREYGANILNISIRHSVANEDSLLSWSRSEVLAFVVYYKQGTSQKEKDAVSVWTRKAIDVAIEEKGTYYLPYQPHATKEQVMRAYPNFEKFAQKKRTYDKNYKFQNALFDKYIYDIEEQKKDTFYDVLGDDIYKDMFYDFLRFVFRTDEKEVFSIVLRAIEKYNNSDDIYRYIQNNCKISVKTLLKPKSVLNILQQIFVQKRTIREQTQQLIDRDIHDMMLIEPTDLKSATKHYSSNNPLPLEKILGFSRMKPKEEYFIEENGDLLGVLDKLQNGSFDLITVYGGLHHLQKSTREKVHEKIYALLKNGGSFVLREHDVCDEEMFMFVSLIHAVFNAVTGESLERERAEIREFESIATIVKDIEQHAFIDSKQRIKQYGDPSANILLCFTKLETNE